MPAHWSRDIAPVPESVSRSISTSSDRSENRLNPASARAARRSASVVIRSGSTAWMRNGSMIVRNPTGRASRTWHDGPVATFTLGSLSSVPASERPDLLAEPTLRALRASGLLEAVGVVEIDPAVSDTAKTQAEFGLTPETLANCVVVAGKREGEERFAACVVLS